MNEKIFDLAKKVKALAEKGGTQGEKAAAEGRLNYLMEKYGFSLRDIESEETHKADFKYKNRHKRLLRQIFYTIMGKDADIYCITGSHENLYRVYVTASQEIELRAMFDHYTEAFDRDVETFYRAFIHRNHLVPRDAEQVDRSQLSEKEIEELNKVLKMMDGIQQSEYHKRLEGKEHE